MTKFIDLKDGQWVLAFDQPFGPYSREMPQHLELFSRRGGGWESFRAREIFLIHQVEKVTPKGYMAREDVAENGKRRSSVMWGRYPKTHAVKAFDAKDDAIAFRDRLFAIGVATDDAIETEMYRRIEKYAAKKRAAAERKIRRLLPHFFGGAE